MTDPTKLWPTDPTSIAEGRYVLEAVLGRGGAASVYRALDTSLGVRRALKVLSPELVKDDGLKERFTREARTIAGMSHLGIVTVHDVGMDGDLHYIVMEEVTGGTLVRLLKDKARPSMVALVVAEALDALEYAHSKGVVHRDVKPHNILLTADRHPRLTDFGIARQEGADRSLTATGVVMGTWSYMAPEQLEPTAVVDHRVDIYSMGATLFAVLTGKEPHGLYDVDADSSRLATLPPALAQVVRKAVRFEPDERYQSAAEMAVALRDAAPWLMEEERVAFGEPYLAPQPDVVEDAPSEPLAGPAAVTFAFGIDRPGEAPDDESEIIADEVYGSVPELPVEPKPERSEGAPELPPLIPVKPAGPVRVVEGGTPQRVTAVPTRTRVLPPRVSIPPPFEPPPRRRWRALYLVVAAGLMVTALVLWVLLMRPDLVEDLVTGLETRSGRGDGVDELVTRRGGVAPPVPSGENKARSDEIVVEIVGSPGSFRGALVSCPSRSEASERSFDLGVARVDRLPSGELCDIGIRLKSRVTEAVARCPAGSVVACAYADAEVVCSPCG